MGSWPLRFKDSRIGCPNGKLWMFLFTLWDFATHTSRYNLCLEFPSIFPAASEAPRVGWVSCSWVSHLRTDRVEGCCLSQEILAPRGQVWVLIGQDMSECPRHLLLFVGSGGDGQTKTEDSAYSLRKSIYFQASLRLLLPSQSIQVNFTNTSFFKLPGWEWECLAEYN